MRTENALSEMTNIKKNQEMFVPLGAGVFVKSNLKDNEKVTVNVGAGIFLSKSVEKARVILKERAEETRKLDEALSKQIEHFSLEANKLEREMQEIAMKLQNKKR